MRDMAAKGRSLTGDRNPSRRAPWRRLLVEKNPARLHPERVAQGLARFYAEHPERHVHGASHPQAKLNDDVVREIRRAAASGETKRSISRRLGVGYGHIFKILRGEIWAHVA